MTERQDESLIGVIYLSNAEEEASRIVQMLEDRIEPVQQLEITPGWESLDGQELIFHLSRFSHIIMVTNDSLIKSRWMGMLYGFCAGSGRFLAFSGSLEDAMPNYLAMVPVYTPGEELVAGVSRDMNSYRKYHHVAEARNELIDRGYGLNDEAMVSACRSNDLDVVTLFLSIGFTPDTTDAAGVPLLNHAVRERHGGMIDLLIEHDVNTDQLSGDRGNSALMDAAAEGYDDLAAKLLAAGAGTDHISKGGQTALMMATGSQHVRCIEMLLEAGADATISDQLGMTAAGYAKLFRNEEVETIYRRFGLIE